MDRLPRTAGAAAPDGDVVALPGGPARRGAAVVLLVAVAVVASSLAGPWLPNLRGHDRTVPEASPVEATPLPEPTSEVVEGLEELAIRPWNLTWLWVGLACIVLAGLLHLAVRWLRSRPRRRQEGMPDGADVRPGAIAGAPGVMPDLPSLREGLDDAEDELRRNRRPAEAVIAAWVALEDSAARSGVSREPAATPTEFTVAVLDRTPADRDATRVLLALYLRARFGSDPVTADDVAAATSAVQVLIASLAVEEPDDDDTLAEPPGDGPADDPDPDGADGRAAR